MDVVAPLRSVWSFPSAGSPGHALTACTSTELAKLRTSSNSKCNKSRSDIPPKAGDIKATVIRNAFSKTTETGGRDYDHMVELWKTFNEKGSLPENEFNEMIKNARNFSREITNLSGTGNAESSTHYYSYRDEVNSLQYKLKKIESVEQECFAFACLPAENSSDESLTVHVRRKTKATECVREFTSQLPRTMEVIGNILTNKSIDTKNEDVKSAISELEKAKKFYPENSWQKQCCETFTHLLQGKESEDGSYKLDLDAEGLSEALDKGKMFFRQMGMLQHAEDSNQKSDFFWAKSAGQAVAVAGIVAGIAVMILAGIFFPPLLILAIFTGLVIGVGSLIWAGEVYDRMKNSEQAKIDGNYFNQKMEEFSKQLSEKQASEDEVVEDMAIEPPDSIWSLPSPSSLKELTCTSTELTNLAARPSISRPDLPATVERIKPHKIRAAFSEPTKAEGRDYEHMVELWDTFNGKGSLPKNEFNEMIQSARRFSNKITSLMESRDIESSEWYQYYTEINSLQRELKRIENVGQKCFAFACLPTEDNLSKSLTVHVRKKTKATECVQEFTDRLQKSMKVIGETIANGTENLSSNISDAREAIQELKKAKKFYPENSWQKKCCETFISLLEEEGDEYKNSELRDLGTARPDGPLEKSKMFFRQMSMLQHEKDSKPISGSSLGKIVKWFIVIVGVISGTTLAILAGIFFPPALVAAIPAFVIIVGHSCVLASVAYDRIKDSEQAKIDAKYFDRKMEGFSEKLAKKPASEDEAAKATAVNSRTPTNQ
jgi:tetratricopeptide (TPR) repeat protein